MEVTQLLEKWSKKTGVTLKTLQKQYEKYLNETKDEKKALRQLKLELEQNSSLLVRGDTYYGFIIGTEGIVDIVQQMRESILRQAENPERREELIAQGKLSPDGEVLDYRRKTGEPLRGEEPFCRMLAIVSSVPEFTEAKLVYLEARDGGVQSIKDLKLWQFYKFKANKGKKQRDGLDKLVVSKPAYRFQPIQVEYKPIEIVNHYLTVYGVSESIDLYFQAIEGSKERPILGVKGVVSEIDLDVRYNKRRFALTEEEEIAVEDDLDSYLICRIRECMPITFSRGDDLVVFGRFRTDRKQNFFLDVEGYVVVE